MTVFNGKSEIISDLSPTALYELAAPSTPYEVRKEVEAKAEQGEALSVSEIKRMKRELAEQRSLREQAENRLEQSESAAQQERERADSILAGQEARVQMARDEALREAQSQLDRAEELQQNAQAEANASRQRLEAAEAEADSLAKQNAEKYANDELTKVQGDMQSAKREAAAARSEFERIRANSENLLKRAEEHRAYLSNLKNQEVEAKALSDALGEVVRCVTLAMGEIHDLEYGGDEMVRASMGRAASICERFAGALRVHLAPQDDGSEIHVISDLAN